MDLVKTSPRDPLNSEISISELGLSTRAVNALMSVGLDTLEKVSSKTYENYSRSQELDKLRLLR